MYASTGDYRHHGEAMLALGLLSSLNKTVAATALAMWDPSDITSLFTTHTGETQVSTDGDTVGLMLDARPAYAAGFSTVGAWMAANGYTPSTAPGIHRVQATNTKRPLYRISGALRSMQYDGLDDCLPTSSAVNLTATDALTFVAGLRKLGTAGASFVEAGITGAQNGIIALFVPNGTGSGYYQFRSRGTAASECIVDGYAPPISNVVTCLGDISSDTCILRVNGAQVATSASDQGTGNFGNYIWNFGSRNNGASLPFNGHEYGSILQSSLADAGTVANYEQWANQRTAAY